jgi:aldose sugar dehydrogenase
MIIKPINSFIIIVIFIIISLIFFKTRKSENNNIILEKQKIELTKPWSLTIIEKDKYLITEKEGNIILYDGITNKKIKHNLNILDRGQGGLLDILFNNEYIYVSYSENRGEGKSSTSIAKAKYNENNLEFKNIFQADPPIKGSKHFGSRIVIKDKYIYASIGERGKGMIAQDTTQHHGSIIRINLDGSRPEDNPYFDKLQSEIYQIGVRNPQGMCLSPFDGKIYITNHGAKGGDWFGEVKKGENYGWKILGWGGTNYSGTKIGPKWKPGYTKAIKYWVPSIAVSACLIYKGEEFPEWKGKAIIASLKDQSLRTLEFSDLNDIKETIIFKGNIGRLRDIKLDSKGRILILTDAGELWLLKKRLKK